MKYGGAEPGDRTMVGLNNTIYSEVQTRTDSLKHVFTLENGKKTSNES